MLTIQPHSSKPLLGGALLGVSCAAFAKGYRGLSEWSSNLPLKASWIECKWTNCTQKKLSQQAQRWARLTESVFSLFLGFFGALAAFQLLNSSSERTPHSTALSSSTSYVETFYSRFSRRVIEVVKPYHLRLLAFSALFACQRFGANTPRSLTTTALSPPLSVFDKILAGKTLEAQLEPFAQAGLSLPPGLSTSTQNPATFISSREEELLTDFAALLTLLSDEDCALDVSNPKVKELLSRGQAGEIQVNLGENEPPLPLKTVLDTLALSLEEKERIQNKCAKLEL